MNSSLRKFLLGTMLDPFGQATWISYLPDGTTWEAGPFLNTQAGQGRNAESTTLTPAKMLEFRPMVYRLEVKLGEMVAVPNGDEPPGWFERTCAKAKCAWFLPMVKRMAAGESVPLEEIQSAYREHNEGKEMPCGEWGVLFSLEP